MRSMLVSSAATRGVLLLALAACTPPGEVVTSETEASGTTSGEPMPSTTGTSATEGTTLHTDTGVDDTSTSSAETEGTTAQTSTGADPFCGNLLLEDGEDCDGMELAGATCASLGFASGTLACTPTCELDDGSCSMLPATPVLMLELSPIKQFDFSWAAVEGADHYQLEQSSAPGEPFVQLGGDVVGTSLSVTMPLHFRHQASYQLRACNVAGCTESAPVDVMSSLAEAVGYFKASNTAASDHFGQAVVLSADGNTLAVNALEEDSNATGIDGDQANGLAPQSGAVYVFVRDATGAWAQEAYIKASNTGSNDAFGAALALSADGSTLAVGALWEDSNATGIDGDQANDLGPQSGAVYVFVRDAMGTWAQEAYVKASNTTTGASTDYFGQSVALSDDGNTLAVGAPAEDSGATGIDGDQADDSAVSAGAVYVFVRDGAATWSQQAYVKATNTDGNDWFGGSVALDGDGDTLAVGAFYEGSNATGIDGDQANDLAPQSGAVYVLERDDMGTWTHAAYVKASNTGSGDRFGRPVALSDDGNTLAVGASHEDGSATGIDGASDDAAPDSGAAYVFVRDDMGAWAQAAYVKASNTGSDDTFQIVALSGDGNTLAVGAYREGSNASGIDGDQANEFAALSGAVYVFVRDDMSTWSQAAYVKAPNPDADDFFGLSVALSADAETLAVGAFWEASNATGIDGDQANNGALGSGAVYLY